MKKILKLLTVLFLSFSINFMVDGFTLNVYNNSTSSCRIYVGFAGDSKDGFYATVGGVDKFNNIANARAANSTIVNPNGTGTIVYGTGPRAIIVDFLNNGVVVSTIAFPFAETNSEIYILGDATANIATSVAYWNLDAVKAKFPNGLIGDAQGNLPADQLALLTPGSTDVKAWNYNNPDHTGLMLCLYSSDLAPRVK